MPINNRHRVSARKHLSHKEAKQLPLGVRLLAWARTTRWIGWGFGESLIPLFIFSFSASFAQTGLLSAVYSITLLVALPIVGMFADKTSAKVLVVIGLLIYPFVGIGYFLAGATGLAVFIVLARVANGVAWAFDGTGIDTYYRRLTDRAHLASSFGYIETCAYGGWILAALLSMVFVSFVPAHYLLLMIAPFALLSLVFALHAPSDLPHTRKKTPEHVLDPYRSAFREWSGWDARLKLLGLLVLFMAVIDSLLGLFIPIDAFIEGANFQMVVLLAIVATIPRTFGFMLGRFIDVHNKYKILAFALSGVALLMIGLAIVPAYAFKLVAVFFVGILMEIFVIIGKSLVTVLGPVERYGQRGTAFESIATMGALAAPLLIGTSFDVLGFAGVTTIIAGAAVVLAIIFTTLKKQH